MRLPPGRAWLLVLAPAALSCSTAPSPPCRSCDGGPPGPGPDTPDPIDHEGDPGGGDDGGAADAAEDQDADSLLDGSLVGALVDGAAWDASSSPTDLVPRAPSDAGYLFFDDFQVEPDQHWYGAEFTGLPQEFWFVTTNDFGRKVFCQDSLDTKGWHIAVAAGQVPAGDQVVEATMRVTDFATKDSFSTAALFGRYDAGEDRGYFVALRGDGGLILRKRDRGTNASWGKPVENVIVPGNRYTVRLEVVGDEIRAFLDGVLVQRVVDSEPLGMGTLALGTYGAAVEVERALLFLP